MLLLYSVLHPKKPEPLKKCPIHVNMKYHKVEAARDSSLHQSKGSGEDEDDDSVQLEQKSNMPKEPDHKHFWYLVVAENFVLVTIIVVFCWKIFVPPPTNLHYQILTTDNKTYPSGQLSWSQHFEALPCGKSPEEAKARGCRFDMLATAWLPPRCIDGRACR